MFYGISAQIARMFDIADVPFSAVSDSEKQSYLSTRTEDGSIQGYILLQYPVRNSCIYSSTSI
jgi:hypothetical protein